MNWHTLQSHTNEFASQLSNALAEFDILNECKQLAIDHICVRLKETADVDALKTELTEIGEVISSVVVNGREISIIQLTEPLDLGAWRTYAIELPHPKSTHAYTDGWEDVEFVIPEAENTMEGIRDSFFTRFGHIDREKLQEKYGYSEDEPHADSDQLPNPTIGLTVGDVGLKFHAKPIQEIVGYRM